MQSNSATDPAPDGWAVNSRGYIQGGFDTPIFLRAKQRFNSMRTQRRQVGKKELVSITNTDPSFIARFTPSNEFVAMTSHEPIIKEQNA